MNAKSGLRVFLDWKIYRPDSVISDVIWLKNDCIRARLGWHSFLRILRRFGYCRVFCNPRSRETDSITQGIAKFLNLRDLSRTGGVLSSTSIVGLLGGQRRCETRNAFLLCRRGTWESFVARFLRCVP